jgi:3-oxoacyl-[acyl-carrier protein] reductase
MPQLGKIALVTGASKGIGRSIALGLAAAGHDVALSYASDAASADAVAHEVRRLGRRCAVFACEIADTKSVARLFERAEAELEGLDVVVASAGIELIDIPFVDYTEAQYDRVFAVNTKGTFFTLQQAAKRVRDGGRIVVISSNTTALALPGFAVYGASKLAPRYFVEVLAKELGPRNVTVNSVVPGVTRAAGVFSNTPDTDPYLQEMKRATPLRRLGTPEDVANAVLLLCSERASFVTGHHFVADGGAGL